MAEVLSLRRLQFPLQEEEVGGWSSCVLSCAWALEAVGGRWEGEPLPLVLHTQPALGECGQTLSDGGREAPPLGFPSPTRTEPQILVP